MTLFDQIQRVRENIHKAQVGVKTKKATTIVAATKTQSIKTVEHCINSGIIHIGENRVQEAISKFESIDIEQTTHIKRMIGHLQSNKINKALSGNLAIFFLPSLNSPLL